MYFPENYITVMTPSVYDYQYLPEVPVSNKKWIHFDLKARGNAHVALSSVYGDTERKTYGMSCDILKWRWLFS